MAVKSKQICSVIYEHQVVCHSAPWLKKKEHHERSPYDSCALFQVFWSHRLFVRNRLKSKQSYHMTSEEKNSIWVWNNITVSNQWWKSLFLGTTSLTTPVMELKENICHVFDGSLQNAGKNWMLLWGNWRSSKGSLLNSLFIDHE